MTDRPIAPFDDKPDTAEERAAVKKAGTPHEEVLREFGIYGQAKACPTTEDR